MTRKSAIRDQEWLMKKVGSEKTTERSVLYKQFNKDNFWLQRKRGRANQDLCDAFDALKKNKDLISCDKRAITIFMSVWLRQQRRLVPSPSTFRRFFKEKTNT
jgi:hypothetical protein